MQDLAVFPLLSPDSDDADSDCDAHSTDSESRVVCEHESDCANYDRLPSAGSTGTTIN
jgi:hypothetical protein